MNWFFGDSSKEENKKQQNESENKDKEEQQKSSGTTTVSVAKIPLPQNQFWQLLYYNPKFEKFSLPFMGLKSRDYLSVEKDDSKNIWIRKKQEHLLDPPRYVLGVK